MAGLNPPISSLSLSVNLARKWLTSFTAFLSYSQFLTQESTIKGGVV